jgi:hypothetical protein
MVDAALIEKCADPSLTPAIIERFVTTAGAADDPLAITVNAGGRLILVPKPHTPMEALDIVSQYIGKASVRVGLTQYPAGIGIMEAGQLDAGLVDSCQNLKLGTALFAKVARIITKWYGSPKNKEVLQPMLDDAVEAWKTGYFEGIEVFRADDPGGATFLGAASTETAPRAVSSPDAAISGTSGVSGEAPVGSAEMRIDLSRIGGGK